MATLRIALAVSVALSAWATPQAHAGGFGIPEIGVRRTAMGAVIGRPDELSSLYHNPAGLVLEDRWRIYMSTGLSLLGTEFQLQPWDRSDEFLGTMPQSDGYYAPVKPSREDTSPTLPYHRENRVSSEKSAAICAGEPNPS